MPNPRKPTAIKQIEGTYRPDRAAPNEPAPLRAKPPSPAHFPEIARATWDEVSALSDKLGVLTETDLIGLEGLASALFEVRALRKIVADRGYVFSYALETKEGGLMYRAYPEIAMIADADRRVAMWVTKFGLSPADRSRVSANKAKTKNDFDDF